MRTPIAAVVRSLLIASLMFLLPGLASAQDFGVMESAETIDRGNFKLRGNPMFLIGRDDADNETGIALAAGYGFTSNFDAELKLAFYDQLMFVGGDAELWLVKRRPLDLSVSAGFHVGNYDVDFGDTRGVDVTVIGSRNVARNLDVYAALDFAFNKLTNDAFEDVDNTFTTVHIVPGIEYKLHRDLDLLAEFGIAANDDGSHYFSIGLAYYIRPR